MADPSKLDVSLDDLIKAQTTKGKGAKAPGRGGSKAPGRGLRLGVAKGRGGGVTKAIARPAKQGPLATRGGGGPGPRGRGGLITVRNPRTRPGMPPVVGGGGGGPPARRPPVQMQPPPAGKWRHDLYDPRQGGGPQYVAVGPGGVIGGGSRGGVIKNKLFVSNLDDKVTDNDMKELFQSQGVIKEAGVHYDKSGRSKGTAHIVFERAQDAQAAYTKYNNVALDGKRLQIELVETAVPRGTIAKLSSGINVSTLADDRVGGGGGGGGGYGSRGGGGGSGFGANRPRSFVRGRGAPQGDSMQE
ncbi:MAG: hypothetical protein J3K34DRAFT_120989 [Monoraphidium minutum]|nr:MAG: hypothetical protein J3K34DRAFT_120989 [Monoraphidium minutum]